MEDALAHIKQSEKTYQGTSLNPCCNGRCTRTLEDEVDGQDYLVLILVVMEDALALGQVKNFGARFKS